MSLAKNVELSIRKTREASHLEDVSARKFDYAHPNTNSHANLSTYCGELIELLNDTNLPAKELLTRRECMNFLVRLLNNLILQPESLLRRAGEYYSQLSNTFEGGFIAKVAQDIRVGLTRNGGSFDSAGCPKSKLSLTIRRGTFHRTLCKS